MTILRLGDPGTDWVSGHAFDCRKGWIVPQPCTCGHAELRVGAWPAAAGEGVLCWNAFGILLVQDEDQPRDLIQTKPSGPISEAWRRLKSARVAPGTRTDPTPPDGLYLYLPGHDETLCFRGKDDEVEVRGELFHVEDVTDLWKAGSIPVRCMSGDITLSPADRASAVLDGMGVVSGAKSLRFTAPGKECWYEGEAT